MGGQSITALNDNAFEHFPNLLAIAMAYNRYKECLSIPKKMVAYFYVNQTYK